MSRRAACSLAAVVVLAAAVLFLRKSDAFLNPQFWAEDAIVFFDQADTIGLAALVTPNAGYYHTIPRLIALATHGAPARFAPGIYSYAAVAGSLVIVAQLFLVARRRLPESTVAPFLVALGPCLLPWTEEVLCNLTNFQWWGGLGLFAGLADLPPRGALAWTLRLVWLALLALTGPFALLFAPLFVLHAALTRERFAWAQLALIGFAAWVTSRALSASPEILVGTGEPHFLPTLFAVARRIGRELIGVSRGSAHFLWLVFAAVAGSLLALAARRERDCRHFLLFAVGCAALPLGSVALKFAADPGLFNDVELGARYFFMPKALALIAVAATWPVVRRARWSLVLWCGLAGVFAFALTRDFCAPVWSDYHWANYADRLDRRIPTSVPINPQGWIYHYRGGTPTAAKP